MKFFSIELYDPKAGPLQFYFNEKHPAHHQYDICVVDNQRVSYHFSMQKSTKGWKIVHPPKLPKWIVNFEGQLSSVILEHLANAHEARQKD